MSCRPNHVTNHKSGVQERLSVSKTTQIGGAETGLDPSFPDLCDEVYLGLRQEESYTQKFVRCYSFGGKADRSKSSVNVLVRWSCFGQVFIEYSIGCSF